MPEETFEYVKAEDFGELARLVDELRRELERPCPSCGNLRQLQGQEKS